MSSTNMVKVYLYTRFERFWHWLQALLIMGLLATGLEVHGTYTIFGYKNAVEWHNALGFSWVILFVFIVFWLLTTGQWKQYIPTTRKLFDVARYYMRGIFRGEEHPVRKRPEAKHNPLQRITYLGLAATILPVQMLTGLLFWIYNDWPAYGLSSLSLPAVAWLHLVCAFAILLFLVIHVYMASTGHTVAAHFAAMLSGWEEVEEGEVQQWERAERERRGARETH